MAARKSPRSEFEDRYFGLLQDSMDRLEKKIDDNTKLTEQVSRKQDYTNGKVAQNIKDIGELQKEVFGKIKPSDLPPIWRDPKFLSIVFNVSLAVLVLIAALTRIDIGGFLP
jgi:hypothetical protein